MSEEELETLKERAENGDTEAIKKLVNYYNSVGNTNEAEVWKELLDSSIQDDAEENDDDIIYNENTQNNMSEEDILKESKKYNAGEYKKYSFLKLDEMLSINPYANFEYGDRYENEQNLEKAIFYYEKGIQLLETYNSNDRDIQLDIQWRWVDIARKYKGLMGKSEESARKLYNAYQNVLEVAVDDVFKIEAYQGLSQCCEKGIGVIKNLDAADGYIKKAHSLYVEGCLIEARLSIQRKDNIEMQKWLEKAQMVKVLGYGKYENDEYFNEILNIKLWLCNIKKLDGKNPEITLETIYNVFNVESKDSHHILANYLYPNEIQELKQKTINFISETLKSEYESINSKDTLYKLITSGNFDYSTNEALAYQMREFLKQYVIKNLNQKVIATSFIIDLYKLLFKFNEEPDEWKNELGKINPEIELTINSELVRLEQEEQKKKELQRQALLAEELRLEQEKQRRIEAEKRRLAEEAEREKQRQIEEEEREKQRQFEEEQEKQRLAEEAKLEEQRKKFVLETARRECLEIEEKILKCNSSKNTSSKNDEEFFSSLKKPIVIFLAIFVIINIFGMGKDSGFVIFCFVLYMIYKILYVDQPQFIADAIKESFNVDIKTWKSDNLTASHDFDILVSNNFVISGEEKLKVYFGKFENCGLFTNELKKSIVKTDGEIENYQNVWIKGYQTTFKGIMVYGALYINLDMNSVIDGEISLDVVSLEMHNFIVEKAK